MGGIGCFMVSFVLAVEHVGFKFTMLVGIAIGIPFSIGEAILGIEAAIVRDWRSLQILAHLPLLGTKVYQYLVCGTKCFGMERGPKTTRIFKLLTTKIATQFSRSLSMLNKRSLNNKLFHSKMFGSVPEKLQAQTLP